MSLVLTNQSTGHLPASAANLQKHFFSPNLNSGVKSLVESMAGIVLPHCLHCSQSPMSVKCYIGLYSYFSWDASQSPDGTFQCPTRSISSCNLSIFLVGFFPLFINVLFFSCLIIISNCFPIFFLFVEYMIFPF